MAAAARNQSRASRRNDAFGQRIGAVIRELENPADLFSGERLEDIILVQNVVLFKRTSAKMFRPHGITHNYHHRFELVIPLRQAGRIHVDGIGYTLEPGQVMLIFPHQFHHFLDVEDQDLLWLFITFELAKPELVLPLRHSPRMMVASEGEFLRTVMNDYTKQVPGPVRSFNLIVRISEFVQRLLSARKADCAISKDLKSDDSKGAILQSINTYVRANLDKPLTIADLAQHTGYSISHLRAVFRKEFGVSLGGYMRDSRLSMAAAMLAGDERETIKHVAKACGFESIFAFSRAFKKAMGLSPSVYSKFISKATEAGTPAERGRDGKD